MLISELSKIFFVSSFFLVPISIILALIAQLVRRADVCRLATHNFHMQNLLHTYINATYFKPNHAHNAFLLAS